MVKVSKTGKTVHVTKESFKMTNLKVTVVLNMLMKIFMKENFKGTKQTGSESTSKSVAKPTKVFGRMTNLMAKVNWF